jgi:hypothetical protein
VNLCDRCARAQATWIVDSEVGDTCLSIYVCEPCLLFYPPHHGVTHEPMEGWALYNNALNAALDGA